MFDHNAAPAPLPWTWSSVTRGSYTTVHCDAGPEQDLSTPCYYPWAPCRRLLMIACPASLLVVLRIKVRHECHRAVPRRAHCYCIENRRQRACLGSRHAHAHVRAHPIKGGGLGSGWVGWGPPAGACLVAARIRALHSVSQCANSQRLFQVGCVGQSKRHFRGVRTSEAQPSRDLAWGVPPYITASNDCL